MSEALLIWVFVGCVNIALTIYTWTLMERISKLLKWNMNLNIEAIDLMRYGINKGYEQATANARLIAAAPEMYRRLKEELIPISDYGGIVSFSREYKIRELLARIDGDSDVQKKEPAA